MNKIPLVRKSTIFSHRKVQTSIY